jgi:segregation and condensation protein B
VSIDKKRESEPTELNSRELDAEADAPEDLEPVEPAEIEDRSAEPDLPFDKLVQRSRQLSPQEVQGLLQSLLLVAEKPLSLQELCHCTGLERERIKEEMQSLAALHRPGVSGIVLFEVAGGWQLRTDPSHAEYVRRLLRAKPQRLTRAAVETLAIIAYRQPVTRPEIEDIRGVDSGAVVKALLERKLVKILGRKEEVGRPILYGTTREFLEFFALRDLASLPTLREFQELTEEHRELVEKEAPAPGGWVEPLIERAASPAESEADGELAELEQAISTADERSRAAAAILDAAQAQDEPDEPAPSA